MPLVERQCGQIMRTGASPVASGDVIAVPETSRTQGLIMGDL